MVGKWSGLAAGCNPGECGKGDDEGWAHDFSVLVIESCRNRVLGPAR